MFFINSGTVLDKYLQEVRRLIYTTNTIEGFNRQLRKVTKAKSVFPTDDSLLKMLYLAMMDITKKMDWQTAGLERNPRSTGCVLRGSYTGLTGCVLTCQGLK